MNKTWNLVFIILILLGFGIFFVEYYFFFSPSALLAIDFNVKVIPRFRISEEVYIRNRQQKRDPSDILILTSGRSGSSFLGEIFKRNSKNTRYVFEPLRPIIENVFIDDHLKFKAIDVVSKFFRCSNTNNGNQADHFLKQEKIVSGKTSRTCFSNKIIVIKELTKRFPKNGSSVLENLLRHCKSWNVRVIHLVRDPRHVIPSMQRLGWIKGNGTSQEQQIRSVCKTIWNNLEYAKKSNYNQVKDNYKLVVFRNMMMHPYRTAEELYTFAGMGSVPTSVRAWIKFSTNEKGNYDRSLTFTTTRNTTKILNRRTAMSKETNHFVQKHCGNIITFIQGFHEKKNI